MATSWSVLIVEDAEDSRELYALCFEAAGLRAVCAESIVDAMRAMRDERIDAVVTDYNLPDGNGLAMLELARHEGLLPADVPAVLCTACPQVRRGADRGLVASFLKPVDVHALVRVVREAIAARKDGQGPASQEMAS